MASLEFLKPHFHLRLFNAYSLKFARRYNSLFKQLRANNEAVIRGLCATAYVGGDTALCRVLGRYKLYVDTTDASVSAHLMLDGYWEMWVTEVLASLVKEGMVVVDVGASFGYYTVFMADLVGPKGAVHAFEPNPKVADRLELSIYANGYRDRATLTRDPLGAEDGAEVFLEFTPGEVAGAHVTRAAPTADAAPLVTRRFDSYPELLNADLIKIDAEGAEYDIWRGMTGLFETSRKPLAILLEFAAVRYADPDAFLIEIEARGFSLADIHPMLGIRPRTRQQILAWPSDADQMLLLRR